MSRSFLALFLLTATAALGLYPAEAQVYSTCQDLLSDRISNPRVGKDTAREWCLNNLKFQYLDLEDRECPKLIVRTTIVDLELRQPGSYPEPIQDKARTCLTYSNTLIIPPPSTLQGAPDVH